MRTPVLSVGCVLGVARSALIAVLLAFTGHHAVAESRWPTPRLPDDLASFPIGEQITVNGLPMRLLGFISVRPPQQLVQAFRDSLGKPLVESNTGNKQVLGRAQGDFYLTVHVEAAGAGSRGTVAITDLASLSRHHEQQRISTTRWLDRLPAGSTIASDMSSDDAGKSARHLVIVNAHSEERNRDALLTLMKNDGFQLERDVTADATTRRDLLPQMAGARTLYFKAAGKQAMAVITRSGDKTAIVLNTVTNLQGAK